MPRFTILEHNWPALHWDFLLEAGSVLRAWRLLAVPVPGSTVPAEQNADHRFVYLDYEGPVSGDRGSVRRWDAGTFEWVADVPERVEVELRGEKLVGRCVIGSGVHGRLSVGFLTDPAGSPPGA
jgi:hypothetical protein